MYNKKALIETVLKWHKYNVNILIVALMLYGYVYNIVKIFTAEEATGLFTIRILGVFFEPVGVILGFL